MKRWVAGRQQKTLRDHRADVTFSLCRISPSPRSRTLTCAEITWRGSSFQTRGSDDWSFNTSVRDIWKYDGLVYMQVAEDFALPAATASSSLRFTAPLLATEHFRLLALRCGTAYYRRLRRHRLWQPSALDSRRFWSRSHIPTFGWSDILCIDTVYNGPSNVFILIHSKIHYCLIDQYAINQGSGG